MDSRHPPVGPLNGLLPLRSLAQCHQIVSQESLSSPLWALFGRNRGQDHLHQ